MDRAAIALATLAAFPEGRVLVFDEEARCVAVFGVPVPGSEPPGRDAERIIGRDANAVIGRHANAFREVLKSVREAKAPKTLRIPMTISEGEFVFAMTFWPLAGASLVACQLKEVGEPSATLAAELRQSEARFAALVAQSAPFMLELDAAGTIVYLGPRAGEIETVPHNLIGVPLRSVINSNNVHPDDLERTRAHLSRFLDRRESIAYRTRVRLLTGAWRDLECSAAWYVSEAGEPRGLLLSREVPDDRRAMPGGPVRALALQSLAGSLVDAVVEMTREGVIVGATPLPDSWDGAGESLVGRSLFEFIHPEDVERAHAAILRTVRALALTPGVFRWRGADGGWRRVEVRSVSYAQDDGETRIVSVGRDVTDELQFVPSLDEAARLDEEPSSLNQSNLAVLAGGVAHDFNNLLTVSIGVTDLIALHLPADSPAHPYLNEVVTASRHAADLARQLLAVTGRPAGPFSSIDVNAVIGSVQALLSTGVPKSVRVEFAPCEGALWVNGDATQVRQLLLNLVTNAGEAIGAQPGKITIATGRFRALDPPGEHDATDWAVMEVRDDGPGIDDETRRRIFEPTFTTKATGHGLGLAVVHSVVRRHGGRISVTSTPSAGTVFRIELPLVTEQVAAAAREFDARLASVHESEGGTIMIVDDDAAVRRVGAAMLGLANFVVLEAPDADSARRLLAAEPNLACAVVDLVMPDADGLALIDELRALRPGLKIVICSGAVNRIPTGRDDLVVLEKPFRYAQLIEAVWRCIER